MLIYEKLKKTMQENKRRQLEVADRMGTTKYRLCRILSGQRGLQAADFLAICMVLGEDPAVYFDCDELATVRLRMEREARAARSQSNAEEGEAAPRIWPDGHIPEPEKEGGEQDG